VLERVRIAGTGLAGLTAAIALADAGHTVEVFEKKTALLPSSGPHSEGIRNYRSLDVLAELRTFGFDLQPFSTITRTIRHAPRFRNVLRGPAHYLFLRGRDDDTVDQILYRRAQAAGVTFHFGESVDSSDVDIAASGPPSEEFNILGAGFTFSARGSSLASDTAYALFDERVAPGGYLVITPGRSSHSIYSVSWKELRYEPLISLVEDAVGIPWIKEILGTSRRVGKIHGHAYFVKDPIASAVKGDTLLAGEAGGFQDAVAGFGFRHAVISASIAARAIHSGEDYRELLRKVYGNEFSEAFRFREKLSRCTNDDYDGMVGSLGPEITLEEYTKRRESRGF